MHLFKNNKDSWYMDDSEVIKQFKASHLYTENNRPENVRLALFIARPEPAGLQSTFKTDEFLKVYGMLSNKDDSIEK